MMRITIYHDKDDDDKDENKGMTRMMTRTLDRDERGGCGTSTWDEGQGLRQ